jgi:hypothetical protein
MADEKKTYLINIESNLKVYAEDAAKAKKVADELKVSLDELKKAGAKPEEIEAATAAHKNANDEYRKAANLLKTAIANNQSETGSRKQLSEQLKLQEQALGKLGNAYIKDAQGVMRLNPAYTEQRKQIAATKQAIIDYDLSLNDGRSNIGRYGEAVSTALKGAGQSILAMLSPMALVAAGVEAARKVFEGLKEAIMSTTFGMDIMAKSGAIIKQMWYDIAINGKISIEMLISASKIQGDLNALRVEEGFETLKLSKINREEQAVRELSIDRTKTHAERLEYLNKVTELENEKTVLKVEHLQKELAAKQELLKQQPSNEKLMLNILALMAKINDTYAEEDTAMRRVNTQRTGFMQEEVDRRKKMTESWMKEIEDSNKAADDFQKKRHDQEVTAEKEAQDFIDREVKRMDDEAKAKDKAVMDDYNRWVAYWDRVDAEAEARGIRDTGAGFENQRLKARDNVDALQNILNLEYGALLASVDYVRMTDNEKLLIDQQYTENTRQLSLMRMDQQLREYDTFASLAGSVSDLFGKQTVAAKGLSVAQALISTYTAGVKAMAELPLGSGPVLRFVTLAAVIAAGLVQVKNILAVKIPGGGGGESMPTSITSSAPVQRMSANPVGSTIFTQQQLSQTQLNAMPNQNLLTADDIARALSKMPPPVVTVEDIDRVSAAKKKISVRANI